MELENKQYLKEALELSVIINSVDLLLEKTETYIDNFEQGKHLNVFNTFELEETKDTSVGFFPNSKIQIENPTLNFVVDIDDQRIEQFSLLSKKFIHRVVEINTLFYNKHFHNISKPSIQTKPPFFFTFRATNKEYMSFAEYLAVHMQVIALDNDGNIKERIMLQQSREEEWCGYTEQEIKRHAFLFLRNILCSNVGGSFLNLLLDELYKNEITLETHEKYIKKLIDDNNKAIELFSTNEYWDMLLGFFHEPFGTSYES